MTQWEDVDGARFEEIDSGEDDDFQEGVRLGSSSINLRNMDKASARAMRFRANGYDYDSEVSDGEDYDLDDDADSTVAYAVELAMRDKEEWLVERALERIRRAQMLGKKNVRLSQRELDALERKRMQTGSSSKKAGSKRRTSDEPVSKSSSKGDRRSSREHYVQYPPAGDEGARGMARMSSAGYGRQSSSSSQRPRTPTTQSLRPQPSISPPNLQQPSPHSQRYSTARPMSSSRDMPFPRTLPDDPQWAPPQRPLSNMAPYSLEESPYLQSYVDPRYGIQARRYAAGLGEAYRSVSNESNRSSNRSEPVFPRRAPHESSQEESSSEEDEEEEEEDSDHVVQVKVKEPSPPRGYRTRAAAAGMGRRRSGR